MPLLLFLRTRIYVAAVLSLLLAVGALFLTSANGPSDFGVLWHHFCGCPPDPKDALILLYTPLLMSFVALMILANSQVPNLRQSENLFLLTRPRPRAQLVVAPILLTFVLSFVIPLFAGAVLLGWLSLVHAPSLAHLRALLQLVRIATHPGTSEPSLWQDLDLPRRLAALLAVMLCFCALFGSIRWLAFSPNPYIKALALLIPLLLLASPALAQLLSGPVASAIFLFPTRSHTLTYLPSTLNITAHLLFAAAWLTLTFSTIRKIEL